MVSNKQVENMHRCEECFDYFYSEKKIPFCFWCDREK